MDGIFEHGGADRHLAAQHILSHDDEGDARGSEVLLRAGVDQGVLVHVRDLAHDAGGHVGHEGGAAVGQIVPLGAEDGVVLGDVDIVDVIAEVLARHLGGEVARHDVVRATLLQKIEGDRLELRGRAALEKEHFILVGDVHQLAHEGDAFVVDGLVDLAAVAELHDAHAGAFIIRDLPACLFQHLQGEHAGACGEIVNSHSCLLELYLTRTLYNICPRRVKKLRKKTRRRRFFPRGSRRLP